MRERSTVKFEHSLLIGASPARVIQAFFDPAALGVWWQAIRSVTRARPLGVYAVEWETTPFRDDVLGRLGGVFHGTVVDVVSGREFFLANAFWIPPDGDSIGPMGLEVTCGVEGPVSRLRVRQTGFDDSTRWSRYYEVIGPGWKSSLRSLKRHLEVDPRTGALRRSRTSATTERPTLPRPPAQPDPSATVS